MPQSPNDGADLHRSTEEPMPGTAAYETELHQLREWKAGAIGACILLYPPGVGPHTEAAYVAHRDRYTHGSEEYRLAADLIAEAQAAFKERIHRASEQFQQAMVRLRQAAADRDEGPTHLELAELDDGYEP